jgi:heme iron utilization protein
VSSSERKHAYTAAGQPSLPEPSFAERARTLLHMGRIGSLSTLSRKQPGFPFGSVMPYSPDGQGRPIFLISTMAMHTQNLKGDPRASLLLTQPAADGDPLGASRVTLLGNVLTVGEPELAETRKLYLERYENSRYWVDYEDFSFYRMEVVDVYYVGGFGVMGWVAAADYAAAHPDPLADSMAGILEHMNADHKDSLVLLAQRFAGIQNEQAVMTAVDRLGFQVRLTTAEGVRGARINFLREVSSPLETRSVLVEMVEQARQG